jgi:hypothetical protein
MPREGGASSNHTDRLKAKRATMHAAHRLDGSPLMVDDFIAHDSKLQFGGLNHGSAAGLNITCRRQGLFGRFLSESGRLVLTLSLWILTDSVEKVRRRDQTSCCNAVGAISEQECGRVTLARPERDVDRSK